MTNEQAIKWLKDYIQNTPFQMEQYERAFEMAIKALSQESEIEENIIKYMKKYPNHVGNTDFWEGFYACRNVVLQLDDEEYSPKEQQPCTDAVSREAVCDYIAEFVNDEYSTDAECEMVDAMIEGIQHLPPVNPQPCDDAISRQAALEAVSEGCQEWRGICGRCEELINALPSVTQKCEKCAMNGSGSKYCDNCGPKSGKWILLDECANSGYYCSNCQKKLVKEGWSNTVKKIKFCPNCGARMESGNME